MQIIGLFLIGILGSVVIISAKKGKFQALQRLDLNIQRMENVTCVLLHQLNGNMIILTGTKVIMI